MEFLREFLFITLEPGVAALELGNCRTARGAHHVFHSGRLCGQFRQFLGADSVAAKQLDALHAQLLHLAQHRAGLRVESAKQDGVWLFGLDAGENGHEVHRLVRGEFVRHHLQAIFFCHLLEDCGQALSERCAVVHDCHCLHAFLLGGKFGHCGSQLVVVGNQAKYVFVARLGQVRVGGGGGDLRNAAVVVNARSRNGGSRLQMADHSDRLAVAQFLRDGGSLFRVARIVFGNDLERHGLAADDRLGGVDFVKSHAHAVFHILADVGDATRCGTSYGERNADGFSGGDSRGGCGGSRGRRCGSFLAATGQDQHCCCSAKGQKRGFMHGTRLLQKNKKLLCKRSTDEIFVRFHGVCSIRKPFRVGLPAVLRLRVLYPDFSPEPLPIAKD